MRQGRVLVLVVVLACEGRPDPDAVRPAEEQASVEAVAPAVPGLEGRYALARVGGSAVPALVPAPGCAVEVLDGSLRLEAGRFVFRTRTRQVCIGGTRAAVLHAAGGTYAMAGDSLVLTADVGKAFTEARGAASDAAITLRQLATSAGLEVVTWRFEREDPPPATGTPDG